MPYKYESGIMSADKLVKAEPGYVYSITIAYRGCTVGDAVTLIDGLTVAGHDEVAFIVPTANGTLTKEWPEGKYFETGIYFNISATMGGVVFAELSFR